MVGVSLTHSLPVASLSLTHSLTHSVRRDDDEEDDEEEEEEEEVDEEEDVLAGSELARAPAPPPELPPLGPRRTPPT